MITLVCTKCSTILNVDDGFAGGVCRCSACGTIQTVPRKGEKPTKSGTPGAVIYERASREAVSKELEALGEVVTSSGIAGSGILNQSARRTPKPLPVGTWIGVGLGAVVALIGAWLVLRTPSQATDALTTPTRAEPAKPQSTDGPRFGSIKLDRPGTIIYLIDRGDATRPFTAPIQSAVVKSLASLGPTRRFQVRYWASNGDSPAFPLTPAEPTEFNRNKAAAWMNEIVGGQSTDAVASLDAALALKPSEIVLITGKAWQMDESFTNQAVVKLVGNPVRVHVLSLGPKLDEDPLARLASKTGGTHLALTSNEIDQLAE
jgi:hypothetical protein